MKYIFDLQLGIYYPKPAHEFWAISQTPCGSPVYCTEMSTWEGNDYPDPISGEKIRRGEMPLEQVGEGDERYWVGCTPSGAFVRLYND